MFLFRHLKHPALLALVQVLSLMAAPFLLDNPAVSSLFPKVSGRWARVGLVIRLRALHSVVDGGNWAKALLQCHFCSDSGAAGLAQPQLSA